MSIESDIRRDWRQNAPATMRADVARHLGGSITETDAAVTSLNDCIVAMGKIAAELRKKDYADLKPENAAKTISYIAKMVDQTVRLLEFAKGNPDSRPDVGLGDLLRFLSNDQFQQVNDWIAAAKAHEVQAS